MYIKSGMIALGLFSVASFGFALPPNDAVRVIVKYKQKPAVLSSLKSQLIHSIGAPIHEIKPMANGAYVFIVDVSKTQIKHADGTDLVLKQLRSNPDVIYAVKDRIGHFKPVPDPIKHDLVGVLAHESQWDEFKRPAGVMLESAPGLKDGAWSYTTGQSSRPIVVAVLDTGIALNDSIVNNLLKDSDGQILGWNFAGNNNDLSDQTQSYHGTHVAGTIAGYGQVMQGMGEDLKILTLKIPDETSLFYESAVVNAIYWSVGEDIPGVPKNNYPANVLNMSFSVDEAPGKEADNCDEALQEAVSFAKAKGAVLVVAAGNDNRLEHFNAPAVCDGTLKIASTGPEGLRSYFSNYGPSATFAAPGGDKRYGVTGGILSTVNPGGGYQASGFDFYQGTSMATPHVAGVAGLIFAAANRALTSEQVEQILYTSTHDFGQSADDNKSCVGKKPCGHGILDAEYAIKTTLMDFDVLFSAPNISALETTQCGKDMLKPQQKSISANGVNWVRTQAMCQPEATYLNPHIEKAKDGAIYAYYGEVRYQLMTKNYSECHVVGYDGVGCYF